MLRKKGARSETGYSNWPHGHLKDYYKHFCVNKFAKLDEPCQFFEK